MRSVLSSPCRLAGLLVAGTCGIVIVAATPARAKDPVSAMPLDFDVANFDIAQFDIAPGDPRAILAQADEARDAEDDEEEGALEEPALPLRPWDDEGLKREWSIQPIEEGPALEVAALGGGRKQSGKLAHVRVSWAF